MKKQKILLVASCALVVLFALNTISVAFAQNNVIRLAAFCDVNQSNTLDNPDFAAPLDGANHNAWLMVSNIENGEFENWAGPTGTDGMTTSFEASRISEFSGNSMFGQSFGNWTLESDPQPITEASTGTVVVFLFHCSQEQRDAAIAGTSGGTTIDTPVPPPATGTPVITATVAITATTAPTGTVRAPGGVDLDAIAKSLEGASLPEIVGRNTGGLWDQISGSALLQMLALASIGAIALLVLLILIAIKLFRRGTSSLSSRGGCKKNLKWVIAPILILVGIYFLATALGW